MYIYKITNLINNKIYIGLSTKEVEESTKYYGSGVLIQYAILKYGTKNFIKEILENNIIEYEELCTKEKYWISYYKSTDRNIGYNITPGGERGDSLTHHPNLKEIKLKMSSSAKNNWQNPDYREYMMEHINKKWEDLEYREKMSNICKQTWTGRKHSKETIEKCKESKLGEKNPMYGKCLSDLTKSKLSDSLKGIKRDDETKKKMSESAFNRIYNETKCPHCDKVGKNNMNRYHFKNCKWKKQK